MTTKPQRLWAIIQRNARSESVHYWTCSRTRRGVKDAYLLNLAGRDPVAWAQFDQLLQRRLRSGEYRIGRVTLTVEDRT